MRWSRRSGANLGIVSPLGKGCNGGAIGISSDRALDNSWDRGGSSGAAGELGPATTVVEVSVGGVGL